MNKKLRDRGENEINFRKMKIAIEAKEPYSLTEELATMRGIPSKMQIKSQASCTRA
jgi:hypothetical protein